MPKKTENFNKDLEGFLRAYNFDKIVYLDTDGKSVPDPADADQFRFNYRNGNHNYGTVTVTTNDGKVTVYYNDAAVSGTNKVDSGWTKFLKRLKDWSLRNGQMGFDIQNIDRLGTEMKKRKQQKTEEQLLEAWHGNKHTSWSDGIPAIKMVIKHTKQIGEGDLRYHHVEKIFLETADGERLLVPSKKPSVGRAFARHLAEGGQYNDDRWTHIKDLAEDISRLGGFVRATRNGIFNEAVSTIVKEATQQYENLRGTIKRLSGTRGYTSYFESWQPTLMEEGGDSDYAGMFVTNKLDPRIERAIPVLHKLKINLGEITEAEEFSKWAESISEGRTPEMDKKIEELSNLIKSQDKLPVGADAMSIKGQLEELIDNEDKRSELFKTLDSLADVDPDNDAKSAIITWLQKNKTDDFCGEVLALVDVEPEQAAPVEAPPAEPAAQPEPATAAPAPAAAPPVPGTPQAPLAERAKQSKPRNFVAKYAQKSGAGKHGKPGHQRHDKHKKKLGEDGYDSDENPVAIAIRRRIVNGRLDLIKQYGLDQVSQAVDDVADGVGNVYEIGSSDVSGWIRQVEDILKTLDSDTTPSIEAVNEHLTAIKKLSGIK